MPILEKYTELVPDDLRGWNDLGVVLREEGKVKRAIEVYNRSSAVDSELTVVKQNLETSKEMQVLL
ncbi:MAG: tetratricopeptide repeat protein [Candidatus Thorarchaeota archaeon]|jgi:Flp pilus assembly protein TadD